MKCRATREREREREETASVYYRAQIVPKLRWRIRLDICCPLIAYFFAIRRSHPVSGARDDALELVELFGFNIPTNIIILGSREGR